MLLAQVPCCSVQQKYVTCTSGSLLIWFDLQAAPWRWDVSVLQVLAEFARVAVTAHQRRGESDAVAFWMYQLMALDCMAPEWQHVMS